MSANGETEEGGNPKNATAKEEEGGGTANGTAKSERSGTGTSAAGVSRMPSGNLSISRLSRRGRDSANSERSTDASDDEEQESNNSAQNGFLLRTGSSSHLQASREVTGMSMKDRYSSFAPQAEVKDAHLERQFTFTGYDIMTDVGVGGGDGKGSRTQQAYANACRQLGIPHVSFIARNLQQPVIRARSRGFGPKEARAIAVALVHNDHVEELDLADNCIGAEGAKCIATTIAASAKLKRIDLSENKIGGEGLGALCQSVASSDYLQHLRLSAIGIKNVDLLFVKNMLDNDMSLRELILTHNSIAEDGCIILGKALADNDTLEVLDLSWNHIRGKGAKAITAGIRDNRGLHYVNLSWNGFAYEGSEAIGIALQKNKTLQELDLSSNRIHAEAMSHIMKGLRKNTSLTHLNLSNNPLTPQACTLMIKAVKKMATKTNLKELDIRDLVVPEEFMDVLEKIQTVKSDFVCSHGSVLTYSADGPIPEVEEEGIPIPPQDPRALLAQLIQKDGLRIVDLFRKLDGDDSWTVTREEFKDGIMKAGLDITEDQLDELVNILDKNNDGEVDLREMTAGQREYRRKDLESHNRKAAMTVAKETATMTPVTSAVGLDADQLQDDISRLEEKMQLNALKISELAESERKERREKMEEQQEKREEKEEFREEEMRVNESQELEEQEQGQP